MSERIFGLSLSQMMEMLGKRKISSLELVSAYLERIHQLNPRINAFINLVEEDALSHARNADEMRIGWQEEVDPPLPLLLGLPLAVKDLLSTANIPTTCGSRMLEGYMPPYHATCVERLVNSGMIILGKTNTDEFGMGSTTENSAFMVTRNPWNPEHAPGGSSGGSAAAVAVQLVPAALGTDTGGSVRQPASHCGVTGIKPTYGRTSRFGLIAYSSSLDTVGVLACSAEDAALIFQHYAGYDPRDPTSLDVPISSYIPQTGISLKGLRIGMPEEFFAAGLQAEVTQAVNQTAAVLESLGAELHTIHLPHTEYAVPVYYIIASAEASANLARYDGVGYGLRVEAEEILEMQTRSRGKGFGSEVKRRILLGTFALSAGYYDAYYGQAQKVRTLIKRDFEEALGKVDVIISPVAPTTAPRLGAFSDDPLKMYLEDILTLPPSLAGVPAISFPAGFDLNGMPIGAQLIGRHPRAVEEKDASLGIAGSGK
ncbi:MAG: Asp-tRNA(Asn)/Glu-tRNA(Gln) amidotransferase subunit GatA [Deltaproteobacteria bacterium]|nr:Asp-tRNA(Asn)/Glu-tRNA(Gln) amidotransferase subunit GatA [Deltaproteobacteria bacterium]